MRKILSLCIAAIIAVCFSGVFAHARDNGTVNAAIGVEIACGGTAAIVSGDNSPAPDKTRLTLNDGETGGFNITFSSVGEYNYTVMNVPDERDLIFDEAVYKVKIYVDKAEDELVLTYVVTKGGYKYGADTMCLKFTNLPVEHSSPKPDEPSPGPLTDDASRTQTAFLFITAAAAGFLTIPIYMTDRKKKNR